MRRNWLTENIKKPWLQIVLGMYLIGIIVFFKIFSNLFPMPPLFITIILSLLWPLFVPVVLWYVF